MRPIVSLTLLSTLALGACANTPAQREPRSVMERLQAVCEARGGVLVPNRHLTGDPVAGNLCDISLRRRPRP